MNTTQRIPPLDELQPHTGSPAHPMTEVEEALQRATTGQVDAMIDPFHATSLQLRQAQMALRESEACYRRLLACTSALVFELEADGTICFVNEVTCRHLGYRAEALLGQNWWDLLVPSDHAHEVAALYHHWYAGDVVQHKLTLLSSDGNPIALEVTTANRYDTGGRLERIVGLGMLPGSRANKDADIIQHLRGQISQSNDAWALLDTLMTTAPIGLAFLDCNLRFVRVNRFLADINGLSIVGHYGRTLHEVVPKLTHLVEPVLQQVLTTGEPVMNLEISGETQAQPGVTCFWQESFYPVYAVDGAIAGIGVITQDIIRQKQAEAEHACLLAQAQAARAAAEAIAMRMARLQTVTARLSQTVTPAQVAEVMIEQGVAAMGACAGSLVLLNETGQTLETMHSIGYPPELVAGWQQFPLDTPAPMAEVVRMGEAIWLESPEARTQRYPALAAASPVRDHAWVAIPLFVEGRAVGALGLSFATPQLFPDEDRSFIISLVEQCAQALQRAWLYASEQRAREQAEAVVRAGDEVLAIVSHDLKNPLTVIKGRANMLRRQLATDAPDIPRLTRSLGQIESTTVQMVTQINEVLDMARLRTGQPISLRPQPMDLVALVRRLADEYQQTTTQHQIRVDTALSELIGQWDAVRLERVVANLLSNALKYSPDGGEITLEVSCEETPETAWATLVISDQGVGVPAPDLPHIFGQYHRAGNVVRSVSGSGLGLASVQQIIRQHHGTIDVMSEEGVGSTFTVRLPLGAYDWERGTVPEEAE
jgi:PAS domain S-box-containing protein